ncbi:MAG: riboflavin synthase subunit alpha [Gammaproteobacteria bacterium]|nr:riboflavin synthase subunit alpha [Gammaproteobacteria bacterium]
MFTGIVQGHCPVVEVADDGGVRTLTVALGELADGLETGASVALNGTCVTATSVSEGNARFDLVRETTSLTNLGALRPGDRVNVERSFRIGDEVGGHILSGHVACAVQVSAVRTSEGHRLVSVAVDEPWSRYLMPKGFIALDGASLTVAELDRASGTATVSLIPETLARTGLGDVMVGDRLNLEVDSRTQAVVDTVREVLRDSAWVREALAAGTGP